MASMIIDISSDEDVPYTSTPVKTLVVNGITTLDLSTSSTEANKGSIEDALVEEVSSLDLTASTFETVGSPRRINVKIMSPSTNGEFVVECPKDESYYEEPDTPPSPPTLTPAPVLRELTNVSPESSQPVGKKGRRSTNDLSDISSDEGKENHLGVDFNSPTLKCTYGGRGVHYTSTKLKRNRKQPVLVTREIAHCPSYVTTRSRGALSQPAPGWCTYCNHGLHRRTIGAGHGRITEN